MVLPRPLSTARLSVLRALPSRPPLGLALPAPGRRGGSRPNHGTEELSLVEGPAHLGGRDGFSGQMQGTYFLASVDSVGTATVTGKARVSAEGQGLTAASRELEPTLGGSREAGLAGVLPVASGSHAVRQGNGGFESDRDKDPPAGPPQGGLALHTPLDTHCRSASLSPQRPLHGRQSTVSFTMNVSKGKGNKQK